MKKIFFLLVLLSSLSVVAADFKVGEIWYTITSNELLTVEVVSGGYSGDVVIPETVEYNEHTYSVTSIDNEAFLGCLSLTSVTIGESVTSIGDYAFLGCESLTSVTIGESVTSIGDYAFTSTLSRVKIKAVTPPSMNTRIVSRELEVPLGCIEKYINAEYWGDIPSIYAIKEGKQYVGFKFEENGESVVQIDGCHVGYTEVDASQILKVRAKTNITLPFEVLHGGKYVTDSINNRSYSFCPSVEDHRKNFIQTISANTIHVSSASTLLEHIGIDNVKNVLYLIVSGNLNGTDILAIRKMANLKILDMTEATIVNGGQSYYEDYTTSLNTIGDYFFNNKSKIEIIRLPNNLQKISNYAFEDCSGLISVTIPNSVTSIGNEAFSGCSGLTSVTIGEGVGNMGKEVFRGCSGLTSVTILCPSVGPWFSGMDSIKEMVLGNKVTYIYGTFSGCSSLTSVTIPNSVTGIGGNTFQNCSGLTSLTIPNSVKSIGKQAFQNCSGLTSLTIPNSVTSIGESAFSGCSGLTSLTIPNSVTSIGESAFSGCSGLTSLTIPNSVTSIDYWAFSGCSGLTSLTIPNSVTSIGYSAFSYCRGLTSVTIPNSVTSIGTSAFEGCRALTSVTIPNSVTSIGNLAFYWCNGLTSVTIGENVTSIGFGAFGTTESGYSNITEVISLNTTPPTLDVSTFDRTTYAEATLKVPQGCKTIYWLHPYWENFNKIEEIDVTKIETPIAEDVPTINDGKVYNLNGKQMNIKPCETNRLVKGVYIVNGKKILVD